MATLLFSLAGFFLVIISLIAYLSTIPRAIVPENTGSLAIRLAIGVALALIALFLAISGEGSAGFFIYVPAIAAILFGGFFLWVLTLSKTPIGNIKVSLGDKILPFKAKTSNAESFDSKQLLGKRILFKFFRGGWCPYCAAELKAFNHMLPELEKYQISIMALSKDIPSQAAIQKTRDKLNFTLLSDPDLTVIRAYGLEHHKTLGQSKNPKFTIGGLVLGIRPFHFAAMAIPTTLLIDEHGIIRWIDQSEDYRLRSNNERILKAVKKVFANS